MTPQQIRILATITSRYYELNALAKKASNAIEALKFKIFTGSVSDEDLEILAKAQSIAERIADNHTTTDAIKYFTKLEKNAE